MKKLNYMMADFKLRVDHITYDAIKKLDALKEELRPVKPIPPVYLQYATGFESKRQALIAHRNHQALMLRASLANIGDNNANPYNQALNINAFNQGLHSSQDRVRIVSYPRGYY
jgi:hypothetical protein